MAEKKDLNIKIKTGHLDSLAGTVEKPSPDSATLKKDILSDNRPVDKNGDTFNPDLHEINEDGSPVLTKDGVLRIKRGKKPGSKPGLHLSSQEDDITKDNQLLIVSDYSASMFIQAGVMFFGDEWLPQSVDNFDEKVFLTDCFKSYYKVKGIIDIPVGWGLAIGLLGYSMRRFQKPVTQSRLSKIFSGMKNFFVNIFKNIFKRRTKIRLKIDDKDIVSDTSKA